MNRSGNSAAFSYPQSYNLAQKQNEVIACTARWLEFKCLLGKLQYTGLRLCFSMNQLVGLNIPWFLKRYCYENLLGYKSVEMMCVEYMLLNLSLL
jgi:hypothetical protein